MEHVAVISGFRRRCVTKTCEQCGQPFSAPLNLPPGRGRFCSKPCRGHWQFHAGRSKIWNASGAQNANYRHGLYVQGAPRHLMPIANQRVCDAIRDGKMARQPCEECGKQNTHAHHDDYAKPLDVRWLCPRHHGALHAEMRRQTGVLRRSPPPRMVGSGRSSSKAL